MIADLSGKTTLATGGGQGIGSAVRPTSPHYVASKAALMSCTRSMAAKLAPYRGVRVV